MLPFVGKGGEIGKKALTQKGKRKLLEIFRKGERSPVDCSL